MQRSKVSQILPFILNICSSSLPSWFSCFWPLKENLIVGERNGLMKRCNIFDDIEMRREFSYDLSMTFPGPSIATASMTILTWVKASIIPFLLGHFLWYVSFKRIEKFILHMGFFPTSLHLLPFAQFGVNYCPFFNFVNRMCKLQLAVSS